MPKEREKALDALWASICHQGSVYEASCAAIPFLIRILELVPEDQRPPLLILLADLTHRDWYANQDRQTLHVEHHFDKEHCCMVNSHRVWPIADFLKSGNKVHEPHWMEQAHRSVGEGLQTYLRLLQTNHLETVLSVLYVLAGFREFGKSIVPAVHETFSGTSDVFIQASALLCLSTILDERASLWERYRSLSAKRCMSRRATHSAG